MLRDWMLTVGFAVAIVLSVTALGDDSTQHAAEEVAEQIESAASIERDGASHDPAKKIAEKIGEAKEIEQEERPVLKQQALPSTLLSYDQVRGCLVQMNNETSELKASEPVIVNGPRKLDRPDYYLVMAEDKPYILQTDLNSGSFVVKIGETLREASIDEKGNLNLGESVESDEGDNAKEAKPLAWNRLSEWHTLNLVQKIYASSETKTETPVATQEPTETSDLQSQIDAATKAIKAKLSERKGLKTKRDSRDISKSDFEYKDAKAKALAEFQSSLKTALESLKSEPAPVVTSKPKYSEELLARLEAARTHCQPLLEVELEGRAKAQAEKTLASR